MHPLAEKSIERAPQWARRPLTLVAATGERAAADRLAGLAAELAFWVLLSLPALLLTAIAVVSLVAGEGSGWQEELIDRILEVASVALTSRTLDAVVEPVLVQLVEDTTISVVSIAFLATIWTASRAVKVVLVTIAITYGEPQPNGVGRRVLAFALTLAGLVIGLLLAPLLIVGPAFGERIGAAVPALDADAIAGVWRVGYWPAVVLVATVGLASLYHVGAPWATRWRRDIPGAILATALWLAGSAGLRLYGTWILGSDSAYGPLAGPIVGLLWVWVTGFAVLLGAELNAQIEQLWPTRDAAAEDGDTSVLGRLTASVNDRRS